MSTTAWVPPTSPTSPLAGIGQRYLAAGLDYLLYALVFIFYIRAYGEPNAEGGYTVHGIRALPVFLYWVVYFPVIEGLWGRTLFKSVLRLRVIRKDDLPFGLVDALKRHVFDPVDLFFFGLVGVLVMKSSPERQRIGDQIARTLVIREGVKPT